MEFKRGDVVEICAPPEHVGGLGIVLRITHAKNDSRDVVQVRWMVPCVGYMGGEPGDDFTHHATVPYLRKVGHVDDIE